MIGLVQVGTQGMADRYAYLPMIGILIAVVWGTSDILVRITGKLRSAPYQAGYYRVAAFAAGTVILATSTAAMRHQLGFWKNDRTLFSHALAVTRDNPVSETLLGNYYARSQQWDEAIRHYRLALANDPNYGLTHFDLGNALEHLGQAEAVAEYERVLQLQPGFEPAEDRLQALKTISP